MFRDLCNGVCLSDIQNFQRHPLPWNISWNGHWCFCRSFWSCSVIPCERLKCCVYPFFFFLTFHSGVGFNIGSYCDQAFFSLDTLSLMFWTSDCFYNTKVFHNRNSMHAFATLELSSYAKVWNFDVWIRFSLDLFSEMKHFSCLFNNFFLESSKEHVLCFHREWYKEEGKQEQNKFFLYYTWIPF